jgi:hypothetical protein
MEVAVVDDHVGLPLRMFFVDVDLPGRLIALLVPATSNLGWTDHVGVSL